MILLLVKLCKQQVCAGMSPSSSLENYAGGEDQRSGPMIKSKQGVAAILGTFGCHCGRQPAPQPPNLHLQGEKPMGSNM